MQPETVIIEDSQNPMPRWMRGDQACEYAFRNSLAWRMDALRTDLPAEIPSHRRKLRNQARRMLDNATP